MRILLFLILILQILSIIPQFHLLFSLKSSIIQVHHDLDDDFLDDVLEAPPDPIADPIPLRKSSRISKPSSYL